MKILIVNTNPTQREGMTNVIFNLLENINVPDLKFGYVSINNPDQSFVEKLRNLHCQLHVIPRRLKSIHLYFLALSKIASGYDAIHVHGNSATIAIDLCAAAKAGVKHRIAHSHNTSCKMFFADKLLRPLFYKLCNGKLACGIEAGRWLYGHRNFQIIKNGIDTKRFQFNESKRKAIRDSLGWEDKIIVGHVGNFVEAKNHKLIFEIIKIANKTNKDIKLICIGSGRLFDSAKAHINSLSLNNHIYLSGSISNPEDYMSAMDIILMPSLHEGLPLTLVEEQANGLTCLVADTITKEADLTGNIHYLSLQDEPEIWSQKLLKIVSTIDNDRISNSRINIRKIKDKGYDINIESKKLVDFYRNLVQSR